MAVKAPAPLKVIGRSVVDWWDSLIDLVLVVILWLVAQVTVIFGPPATFGLYYVCHNLVNGESTGVRGLIEGARKYFWKAWIWALINIAVIFILYINFLFYGQINSMWAAGIQALPLVAGGFWAVTQFYALPFLMEQQDKRLWIAIKNGFLTGMASPLFTLILMIVVLLVIALSLGLVLPTFFGLPALIPILGLRGMQNRLEAFGLREPEKDPKELDRERSSMTDITDNYFPNKPGSSSK